MSQSSGKTGGQSMTVRLERSMDSTKRVEVPSPAVAGLPPAPHSDGCHDVPDTDLSETASKMTTGGSTSALVRCRAQRLRPSLLVIPRVEDRRDSSAQALSVSSSGKLGILP